MNQSEKIVPDWILMVTSVSAFLAIADLPYGYYRLLRWVVCAVAIASAMQLHRLNLQGWVWVLGCFAILFNPFVPVPLGKSIWRFFDGAAGVAFLVVMRHSSRPPKNLDS